MVHHGRGTGFTIQTCTWVQFFHLPPLVAGDCELRRLSSLASAAAVRKHYGFYGRCLK